MRGVNIIIIIVNGFPHIIGPVVDNLLQAPVTLDACIVELVLSPSMIIPTITCGGAAHHVIRYTYITILATIQSTEHVQFLVSEQQL